jgi:hypothetical protein
LVTVNVVPTASERLAGANAKSLIVRAAFTGVAGRLALDDADDLGVGAGVGVGPGLGSGELEGVAFAVRDGDGDGGAVGERFVGLGAALEAAVLARDGFADVDADADAGREPDAAADVVDDDGLAESRVLSPSAALLAAAAVVAADPAAATPVAELDATSSPYRDPDFVPVHPAASTSAARVMCRASRLIEAAPIPVGTVLTQYGRCRRRDWACHRETA